MSNINIGANIKKIRLSKNMTQQNVADLLGMSQAAYRKFEIDNAVLRTDTLMKIAKVFDVTLADLVADTQTTDENIRLKEIEKHFNNLSDNAQKQAINIIENLSEIDK